ncbi:hypothetical protein Pint_04505 [Pistacia integerrima]|uniref:Uncharacterized protein n=1 Tax=Pistacia integerrima TaxID=434235 RepID=A0ACC0Z3E2_9ROSI|nr:hypothetical protein Pint_04505 [Pistacia integerrima]
MRHCSKVPATAFSNLMELSLEEEVIVWGCGRLEHFVSSEEEDNKGEENVVAANGNDILLPKLRRLGLEYLPNLISLCPKNYKSTWPTTLEELVLRGFRNFAPSFIVELEAVMKNAFEASKTGEEDGSAVNVTIWSHLELSDILPPYKEQ